MSKYKVTINNKTFEEFDEMWVPIGKLLVDNIRYLNGKIGLYKLLENKEIIYIGKGTESNNGNKGLYKRLNNYISQTGKYKAHEYINNNQKNIDVEIIVLGDNVEARAIANGLESLFIDCYRPKLNNHK